jgi:hypothetical protein
VSHRLRRLSVTGAEVLIAPYLRIVFLLHPASKRSSSKNVVGQEHSGVIERRSHETPPRAVARRGTIAGFRGEGPEILGDYE